MIKLVKLRLLQIKNEWQRGGKAKFLLLFLLGLFFLWVLEFFFHHIFRYLAQMPEIPLTFRLFLAEKFLTMIFLTLFSMQLLSALLATLDILFLSRDLNFLFSTPLPVLTIFRWKALEIGLTSSAMAAFFSIPVIFSFCRYFAPGMGQIFGFFLAFMMFLASGVLFGILLGLLIPSFFSIRRLQPVISVFSVLLLSFLVVFLRLLRPERLLNPSEIEDIFRFMGSLNIAIFNYFPFSWLARSATFLAEGQWGAYWRLIMLFAIVFFMAALLIRLAQHTMYIKLIDKLQQGSRGTYKSNWPEFPAGIFGTLWRKENKTFWRNPAQWSQLLIIGALVLVFLLNLRLIPLPNISARKIIAYLNLGVVIFIVMGLNSRFTFTSIPLEGPGIVHVHSSKLAWRSLFAFKFWYHFLPLLGIGMILYAISHFTLHFDVYTRVLGLAFLLPAIAFNTMLALYFGVRVKSFTPISPQHLVASHNGIAFMLWSMVHIVASMFYFIRPTVLYYVYPLEGYAIPYGEISSWFCGYILLHAALILFFYRRTALIWQNREF